MLRPHTLAPLIFIHLVIFLSLSACQTAQEPINNAASSIAGAQGQGGRLVEAGDPGAKSTVALMVEDQESGEIKNVCTGSIIGPKHVLTAAHCIRDTLMDGQYTSLKYVYLGLDLAQPEKRKIRRAIFHRQYGSKVRDFIEYKKRLGFINVLDERDEDDIGLVEIEGEWPAGYESVVLASGAESIKSGTEIKVFGYGKIEVDQPDNSLLRYGSMISLGSHGQRDFTANSIAPEHYNPCYGDSGGPALVMEDGTWKLAGIIHKLLDLNGEQCEGGGAAFTLVSEYTDWIQSAQQYTSTLLEEGIPVELAHPLDEHSVEFQKLVARCESTISGSEEEHTFTILKTIAGQTSCVNAARVLLPFTHLSLDYTNNIALGDFYYGQYFLGELALNPITNVQPFALLPNLKVLSLAGHAITDLRPLNDLEHLSSLDLRGNGLTSAQLKQWTNGQKQNQLIYLDIAQNGVTDIESLEKFTALQSLNIMQNQISNLSPLSNMTDLLLFDAESNQISNLAPLTELQNLAILNLGINLITDLSPLSHLTRLVALDLNTNPLLTDLSPLRGLQQLRFLILSKNPQLQGQTCPISENSGQGVCYF